LLESCTATFKVHGPRRLRKYSDTRAAIAFRVWHRILRVKLCLRQAVCSCKYVDWESKIKDKDEKERAKHIREIVCSDEKFTLLALLVDAFDDVYKLLRLVDGYTPVVGKVYYKANRIDAKLRELMEADNAPDWYEKLHTVWVRDWGYMHVDLHSLGYCVDPEYHALMTDMPADVWDEFVRCATRMLKAAPAGSNFSIGSLLEEYSRYQNLEAPFSTTILELSKTQPAHIWWQQWDKATPSLQFVSMRGLSQTVAASCS
jgi:hypothetical protein